MTYLIFGSEWFIVNYFARPSRHKKMTSLGLSSLWPPTVAYTAGRSQYLNWIINYFFNPQTHILLPQVKRPHHEIHSCVWRCHQWYRQRSHCQQPRYADEIVRPSRDLHQDRSLLKHRCRNIFSIWTWFVRYNKSHSLTAFPSLCCLLLSYCESFLEVFHATLESIFTSYAKELA